MCSPQFRVPMTIVYTRDDGTKEVYLRKEELGHGGFAIVYRVVNQKTNRDYALKVISKERYEGPKGEKSLEKLKNEIQIQKSCNHPNIVKSYGTFSDTFNYYIILEFCSGKSIAELAKSRKGGYLSEQETRKILQDVIRALTYLHHKHIIHRDLKLENYMIGADGRVKIGDFGISTILKNEDEKRFSICGTPNYLSPELLQKVNKGHSYEVDIWAIGVSAFAMLTGHPPFEGGRKQITYENIKNCQYRFPSYINISNNAKDFIRTILKIDPDRRPTAMDLATHPFLKVFSPEPVNLSQQRNEAQQEDVSSPTRFVPSPLTVRSNLNNNNYNLNSNLNFNSNIPGPLRPRLPLPPKTNLLSPLVPTRFDVPENKDYSPIQTKANDIATTNLRKTFNLPNYFVLKISFHGKDLIYLLADGTVGICFDDRSRLIMDPNENFIQFYQNYNSSLKSFDMSDLDKTTDDGIDNIRFSRKISLLKRYAVSFKKFKKCELSTDSSDSSVPLHHVKYFLNKNGNILFKFSDKNAQINFSDHKKLAIFSNTKQMCLVRSIKENCALMSINNVITMDPSTEELKRYNIAKDMMNDLIRSGKV